MHRRLRPWTIALLSLLALAPAADARRLRRDGNWVRDDRGRVVLLRGMNYSGLEFGNFFGRPRGPEEADFDQMASWGVNVIRLPVAWHYLEPSPGVLDRDHLRTQVDPIVAFARARGMFVVLELHQFQWSPCVGGNGVPAWSCEGKGYTRDALGGFTAQHDFWAGAPAPDGRTLVDHLLDVWGMVARHYRRSTTVAGFDFLNEPLDFLAIDTFEHDALYPFYRRAVEVVRRTRARQMLVIEPPVVRNTGRRALPEPVGDRNLLYAPHLYTTTFGLDSIGYTGDRAAVDRDYAQALEEAAVQDAVLWVGEHGGNADRFLHETEQFFHDTLEEQDERLVGGVAWAYFPSGNGFSVVDADGGEKGTLVDQLARPYPMQTAGIPAALHWDPDTRVFTYTFVEEPGRRIPDPTIVFVPVARHFPEGVAVEVTPGDRATVAGDRLVVRRDRRTTVHTITVRPAS